MRREASRVLGTYISCELSPIWYVLIDLIPHTQQSHFIARIAHPTGAMATPLMKVSENYHLTMKRAQFATTVSPYPFLSEASSERSESARANHIGVSFPCNQPIIDNHSCIIQARGVMKPPAGVQNGYRSRSSSFTPSPQEGINPSGLYTAIVHNGPLRTRIQDHWNELEGFKAHLQRAQELFFGLLVTLYPLMLVVVWNALVCAFLTSLGQILQRS
jgi:hypothetical protein